VSAIEIDILGLAAIVERPGMPSLAMELVQNALDADDSTDVSIVCRKVKRGVVELEVCDDSPTGFRQLDHAWTMFQHTHKRADAELRGRFNVGCKRVFAHCLARGLSASVKTTKGSVYFEGMERRTTDEQLARGTIVTARMRMSADDVRDFSRTIFDLVVPAGVCVRFGDVVVPHREPVKTFESTLATEVADDEGVLRRRQRKTELYLYEVPEGRKGRLYELGIPVCEMPKGFPFDVDVRQRVPLNVDRDNVAPAYMRKVVIEVLNNASGELSGEQLSSSWAAEGVADERTDQSVLVDFMAAKFGDKYVAFDPTDQEANKRAVAEGYSVVGGRAMSGDMWSRVKGAGLIHRAGAVTPGHRVTVEEAMGLEAEGLETLRAGTQGSLDFARKLGKLLIGYEPEVAVVNDSSASFIACFGNRRLTFNVGRLSWKSLTGRTSNVFVSLMELLIHEFAHEKVSDHLSDDFHTECCRLGAKLAFQSMGRESVVDALYAVWSES